MLICSKYTNAGEDSTAPSTSTISLLDSTTAKENSFQLSSDAIIGIAAGLFVVLCCALVLAMVIAIVIKKYKQVSFVATSVTETRRQKEKSASPVYEEVDHYEEINEELFSKINVLRNEAYMSRQIITQ